NKTVSLSEGIALKKIFKITLKNRIIKMNFNFLNKFLKEILLSNANPKIAITIIAKIIKLSTTKIIIVNKIRKIILEMGFNPCIKEFPGTNANMNFL
ncbi:MAG: hypothetical protein ACFFCM_22835, partial [Promethearchaeota archaeon]